MESSQIAKNHPALPFENILRAVRKNRLDHRGATSLVTALSESSRTMLHGEFEPTTFG